MKNPVHHIWLIFQQLTVQRSVPTWLWVLFVGSMVSNNVNGLIWYSATLWKFFYGMFQGHLFVMGRGILQASQVRQLFCYQMSSRRCLVWLSISKPSNLWKKTLFINYSIIKNVLTKYFSVLLKTRLKMYSEEERPAS